ncbi:hypothetical protein [Paenibacillus qinlingensis]|uniref:Uncharacterized protein n=1 Tax=Paenibacillus qinlingensis TaxID=1837343 RepID=A0ABU1NNZ7_9BACL|nr:hypothetical protein [Paenibacillus qinlingensis]MDR6549188.1 hypothetical protein [Paenibacillus qinlingensis]
MVHMEHRYYPMIIIGATFAGLGAAYTNKEALVIERTALVGHEFINSYHLGEGWQQTPVTAEGEKLKKELLDRGILSEEGSVHIPAIAPVLYNKIAEDAISIMLHTDVTEIRRLAEGFEVTVYNASGFSRFTTDRIMDTRSESALPGSVVSKSLNAMLSCREEGLEVPLFTMENVRFATGKLQGEWIVKVTVDVEDDWIAARHKLHHMWANRPDVWEKWTISAIAGCFELQINQEPTAIEPNWWSHPSGAFRNPLEAFEAGLAFGRGN